MMTGITRRIVVFNLNSRGVCFFLAIIARPYLRAYRKVIALSGFVPVMIALLFVVSQAHAGEIEPRAYANAPVGINFLLAGYAYSVGGISTPGASPIKDAQLDIHTGVLAYARTLNVWGKSGLLNVVLPYSQLSGTGTVSGQPEERNVSGLNDPIFRFSFNFHGAPALSLQEFADYRQDLIIGASVVLSAPLGQYDPDRMVNLGNNRWFVKPSIGISKALGAFTIEVSTGVTFFSKNEDFYGGKTLEQNPMSTTQVHLVYSFGSSVWAALSGAYDYGGRTAIDSVRRDDLAENSRVGATLALPINRRNSIKLYASTGVHTRFGSGTNFDLFGVAWQYRWGRGL